MSGNEIDGKSEKVDEKRTTPKSIESEKMIDLLSSSLLSSCEADLNSVHDELSEFTTRQDEMIAKLSKYNEALGNNPEFEQLKVLMGSISDEMNRLTLIRQEMNAIQEKSERIKMRADKLKSICVSRERREDELVARLHEDFEEAEQPSASKKDH